MLSKVVPFVLPVLMVMISCASQEKKFVPEEYSDFVELTIPESKKIVESPIYVDSVKVMTYKDRRSLVIMGSFPDGCTHIGQATHQVDSHGISLQLEGWRNPELMCTQALVSFSFVYSQIPEQVLERADSVNVNNTNYPVNN